MQGTITSDMKYVAPLSIESYQVDAKRRLRPSAFMQLAQEIAYKTAHAMHFGFEEMQEMNLVWVLSRMQIRFKRLPMWDEQVTLQTWYKGAISLFCLRDFLMLDTHNQPLIEATSCWTVINTASRKMLRSEDINTIAHPQYICHESVFDEPARKVVVPADAEMEATSTHIVSYSDIDVVGHTNNASYLSWAMDAIPYDYLREHTLQEVCISFNHETTAGETVNLARHQCDNTWTVSGRVDGRQAFAISCAF